MADVHAQGEHYDTALQTAAPLGRSYYGNALQKLPHGKATLMCRVDTMATHCKLPHVAASAHSCSAYYVI